ncbi:MAG TPA: class I SAM-dependent methyltransferase [Pseudonocardiaceae bacterium]|nr:class I SAM-dependent methyltransferase [Pseudonocardiaceae bacterium]
MTTLDTDLAGAWVRRWDAQQELYVADREERFAVIGDVVDHTLDGRTGTVLDLGCGPGSLSGRLAARLPGSRIVGLDGDPLLLALAQARYGDTVEFVDADLTTPTWPDHVPDVLDAAVSTTALHWLTPDQLADVYRVLAARLRPGGVIVDGDHRGLDDADLDALARHVRDARAARVGVADHEDWTTWWDAAGRDPALAELLGQRSVRPIAHHPDTRLPIGRQIELLRAAGFRGAGPVWQSGDDFVLVGIR